MASFRSLPVTGQVEDLCLCLHRRQLHFTGFQGNNLIALARRLQALETQTRIYSRIKPFAKGELITPDTAKISSPIKKLPASGVLWFNSWTGRLVPSKIHRLAKIFLQCCLENFYPRVVRVVIKYQVTTIKELSL